MKLTVDSIHKSFGEKLVLDGVSFSVESGSALGLLGRNGAGKTTTIRIIMNVFHADEGSVTIDGRPISKSRLKIGYMPEERGMYPKKRIIDQLVYFGTLRGLSAGESKKASMALLSRLEMEKYASKRLDTLSKGNQQKIQLAATLVSDPDIVVLDEPFAGLDPVNATLLKGMVRELINKGKIVLFSSHQMSYVEEFCDNIAILNRGKIVLSGPIRDIKRGYDRSSIVIRSRFAESVSRFSDENLSDIASASRFYEDIVIIKLKDAAFKKELLQRLSQQSFDIDEFKVFEPALADIFVEYTGDSEQEA